MTERISITVLIVSNSVWAKASEVDFISVFPHETPLNICFIDNDNLSSSPTEDNGMEILMLLDDQSNTKRKEQIRRMKYLEYIFRSSGVREMDSSKIEVICSLFFVTTKKLDIFWMKVPLVLVCVFGDVRFSDSTTVLHEGQVVSPSFSSLPQFLQIIIVLL